MKNTTRFAFLLILSGLFAACNQQAPVNPVGIIDLNKISQETGNAEHIKAELEKIRTRLKTDLQTVQSNLQTSLQEGQKNLGKNPTDEQRLKLGKMLAEAQQKLKQAQESAGHQMKNRQAELVIELRDQVRPIASNIAAEQGMSVVLIKNDNTMIAYDGKSDITDTVIARMKAQGGAMKTEPAKPAMEMEKPAMKMKEPEAAMTPEATPAKK